MHFSESTLYLSIFKEYAAEQSARDEELRTVVSGIRSVCKRRLSFRTIFTASRLTFAPNAIRLQKKYPIAEKISDFVKTEL